MHQFSDIFTMDTQPIDQAITISIPGKLFLAGEYAILSPRQAAIIMAINQYMHFTIQPVTGDCSQVYSPTLSDRPLQVLFQNNEVLFENDDQEDWSYLQEALKVVNQLFNGVGLQAQNFKIEIHSELEDGQGQKFGMGSSGAVTVGTILALLNFNGLHPKNSEILFKLAAIANIRQGSNGSMGDIAAVASGQWIYYQAFNRQWLLKELEKGTLIHQLLIQDWPELVIEPLPPIEGHSLAIGWTGQPASTQSLVAQLQDKLPEQDHEFEEFCWRVHPLVQELKQAITDNKADKFVTILKDNQSAIDSLGHAYHLPIMTEKLTNFIHLAEKHGAVAKVSGAGGGDCGICFYDHAVDIDQLIHSWEAAGITYLPLGTAGPIKL